MRVHPIFKRVESIMSALGDGWGFDDPYNYGDDRIVFRAGNGVADCRLVFINGVLAMVRVGPIKIKAYRRPATYIAKGIRAAAHA